MRQMHKKIMQVRYGGFTWFYDFILIDNATADA